MADHTSWKRQLDRSRRWNTGAVTDLSDLIERLRRISEELADRALDELKEAHRVGATKRPDAEKSLSQARRAVEKAIATLSRTDSSD